MGRGANIRVGETETLRFSGRPTRTEVIEDRGNLGPNGLRVLRVRVYQTQDDVEPREFELSEDVFDHLLVDEAGHRG